MKTNGLLETEYPLPPLQEGKLFHSLEGWDDTVTILRAAECVHRLFEAQVRRSPEALAVSSGSTQISYRQLNEMANRVAHRLRKLGVGPETLVGICMERCTENVIGLLGILKAGGAYIPLDPGYPGERLAFMISDAQVPVLITQQKWLARLPPIKAQVICLDELECGSVAAEATNPPNQVTLKNLAYIIYTSGSTGTPKGVEIEHGSLANLIAWHQHTYGVTPSDRATQLATPAFDASVWELWPYLTAGASIHIPDEETRLSPQKLPGWLTDHQITLTFIPTPIAEAMFAEPWPRGCVLRTVLTGGDKLHRAPGKNFPCPLVNHYGPTENTVVTTWAPVPPHQHQGEAPPIGRPVTNTQVYVLDRFLQPVPVGEPGELHIGGLGLARGYHNRPKLTAEKFIPDPFGHDANARLYKTGDRVRWRADGNLEFLGRMDNQVKIRGCRIELGEVETVLGWHPDVREAVVVAREHSTGENRLAAYIVPVSGRKATGAVWREFLKQKLPDTMVPSTFTLLEALPLTPNGKVDRAALPAPRLDSEATQIAPRTEFEEKLAGIWREVLSLERVGIHDNFFELGGHSLLATQAITRMRSEFQTHLPVRTLFEYPTIAALAAAITSVSQKMSTTATTIQPRKRGRAVEALMPLLPRQAMQRYCSEGESTTASQINLTTAADTGLLSEGSAREGNPRWPALGGEIDSIPLSFGQQRLCFLDQMEPNSPLYNIPCLFRLRGPLDVATLKRSLEAVVERHEALRTVFVPAGEQPAQVVRPPSSFALPLEDLSALPEGRREGELRQLARNEATQPFDLKHDRMLRARLFRLGETDHALMLVMHHVAADGWSMAILYRELGALYAAFSKAQASPLREPPIQYADFALWQQEYLRGETLQRLLNFWKKQLAGAPALLELPADRPRPPVQSYHGDVLTVSFPPTLGAALKDFNQQQNTTLFMTLFAAFNVLLHRYTGRTDTVVGSPIAGRDRPEMEGLIGFFVNTLVLRTDLSGDPTFKELLARVRDVALAAYDHQETPFEKLVEELQPERNLSYGPLCQVVFALQNMPSAPLKLPGLSLNIEPVYTGTAKFDLTVWVSEEPDGLSVSAEYNTDLFLPDTIRRLLGHFQTLLQAAVTDAGQRLSQLPLLTDGERQQILAQWNDTRAEFPGDKCVHQLFEKQVERTPDAIALAFADEELTYRELNGRANALASELRALGVGPGVPVGLCVNRSWEMLAGLLGILKAGGCYVPLDPAYPKERLAFMLEDSQAPVLLAEESVRARFQFQIPNLKTLSLDAPRITNHEVEPKFNIGNPQSTDPSYVIYTSGSTGKPKGVVVPHRAVVNFLTSMAREPGLTAGDLLVAVTTLCFDIAALELLLPLTLGAKIVIATHDESMDGPALRSLLERHRATVMQATPVTWQLLLEAGWRPGSGFKALVGGEALPKNLADQLIAPGVELWNMYGPTETTVWSTCARVTDTAGGITIGKPIANTTIRILDERKNLCPTGIPGELYIGGDGVALGYWKRPELTAERFILDPFSTNPEARLYRTGDRARWRNDGTLEHLGRLDFQVKLRGFRIELGEIEAAIAQHSAVREVAAILREDTPGEKRLVAYVVAENPSYELAEHLRANLRATMPEYMIPAQFVALEALPRTHNGKLDRMALPAPTVADESPHGVAAAPQTPTEEMVLGIFREVLGRADFGVLDNFFHLGGQSLIAARLLSRLRTASGVDLPLRDLFKWPTAAGLAEAVDALQWLQQSTVPTDSVGIREEIVL